jgi:hypothetical protein
MEVKATTNAAKAYPTAKAPSTNDERFRLVPQRTSSALTPSPTKRPELSREEYFKQTAPAKTTTTTPIAKPTLAEVKTGKAFADEKTETASTVKTLKPSSSTSQLTREEYFKQVTAAKPATETTSSAPTKDASAPKSSAAPSREASDKQHEPQRATATANPNPAQLAAYNANAREGTTKR